MNSSHDLKSARAWMLVGWLLSILSGGLMTSLLRAPHVLTGALPIVVMSHLIGGSLIAITVVGLLVRGRRTSWWRLVLVSATLASGWLTHRSFSPLATAGHAALAAFASLAVAQLGSGRLATSRNPARRWTSVPATVGFGLVAVQVAAGAALRQHLIGLAWHLLAGGVATMVVLGTAVATTQHERATLEEKRVARSAIAAILVQISLGVAVLFMLLVGPPNDGTWIAVTVGHVLVGTLTLLAVGRFAWVLHHQVSPDHEARAATSA